MPLQTRQIIVGFLHQYLPSNRNEESPRPINSFIDVDPLIAVDAGYSMESQFQIIANTAEYLFYAPTNATAKTIVSRWIRGIFSWLKSKEINGVVFRPPTLFFKPSEGQTPASYPLHQAHSSYSAAMILKVAIYANLAGVLPDYTVWLIIKMLDYIQTLYVSSGEFKGTWTKFNTDFAQPNQPNRPRFKIEHFFETIRAIALFENKKTFLNFPTCNDYDNILY